MTAIEHCVAKKRFVIEDDGLQCLLEYQKCGDNCVDFTHTYVPPELRTRGYAVKLVNSGLCWAHEQGYSIQASCWFVARFLRG
jgi:predicted GNAT family acetyltransferase